MIKKLLNDILTNEDNISFSAKRVAGFLCLIATHIYAFIGKADHDIMFTLSGLTATFFGLTTIDNKIAKDAGDTNGKNP